MLVEIVAAVVVVVVHLAEVLVHDERSHYSLLMNKCDIMRTEALNITSAIAERHSIWTAKVTVRRQLSMMRSAGRLQSCAVLRWYMSPALVRPFGLVHTALFCDYFNAFPAYEVSSLLGIDTEVAAACGALVAAVLPLFGILKSLSTGGFVSVPKIALMSEGGGICDCKFVFCSVES